MSQIKKGLLGVTLVLSFASLLNKGIGFLREMQLATLFGASLTIDLFLVASLLPVTILTVINAALSASVVPFVARAAQIGHGEVQRVYLRLFNGTAVISSLLAILILQGTPLLVRALAPGYGDLEFGEAVFLTRLMLPLIILQPLNGVLQGVLNGLGDVITPVVAVLVFNFTAFLAILLFGGAYGTKSLALGLVIGTALQCFIQLWMTVKKRLRWQPRLYWEPGAFREILAQFLPTALALGAVQFSFSIQRIYATMLPEGAISQLNYASRLLLLPIGVFGQALATAIYPIMAQRIAANEISGYHQVVRNGLRLALLVTVPFSILSVLLSKPLVQVAFGRGAFDASAVVSTAQIFAYGTPLIVALAATEILNRAAFARGDVWGPAVGGLVSVTATAFIGFPAATRFGAPGLIALTALGQAGAAFWLMRAPGLRGRVRIPCSLVIQILVGSVAAGVIASAAHRWLPQNGHLLVQLLSLLFAFGIAAVLFAALAYRIGLIPKGRFRDLL